MAEKTIGSQAADTGRLTAKDFIFCAVFGVLVFFITMAFAMVCSFDYRTCWSAHAVSSLISGMAWMYIVQRVPKRGAMVAMGTIMAVLGFVMGMFWTGPTGILVGCLAAELILGNPATRTKGRVLASFPAFILLFWLGHISLVYMIGADAYVAQCVQAGMAEDFSQNMVNFMYSPAMAITGIATIICATLGGLIGTRMFAKHFKQLGVR
ncbi:MAG: MptD family putative ECF transporter S component [Olsenella sp.]